MGSLFFVQRAEFAVAVVLPGYGHRKGVVTAVFLKDAIQQFVARPNRICVSNRMSFERS